LQAVNPIDAIRQHVRWEEGDMLRVGCAQYEIKSYQHIYVVGAGKAGASMAQAVEELLGSHLTRGIVNVKYAHLALTRTIELHEAAHPVPDEAGVRGTQRIIDLLESATDRDLVLCLISGGGSALLTAPAPGISLQHIQAVTTLLLQCGAPIEEINTIRKHLSAVKGGQLARIAAPTTLITLILSDVIGDPLDMIASGPTVPDPRTFQDCMAILRKYDLVHKLPQPVLEHMQQGVEGVIAETPKTGDPAFEKTQNLIIASNTLAAEAAAQKARELRYNTLILSTVIEGETRDVAKVHTAIAKEILHSGNPLAPPACLISGGETTVTIRGEGLGGRNQEFVLAAADEIQGRERIVVLSAGTDGTDGPTDAAGAIADDMTVSRATQQQLELADYLNNNDSYHFFEALGDLIKTGPTNTNVMDLRIVLVG
jgi:hydroxypyruvate reductase